MARPDERRGAAPANAAARLLADRRVFQNFRRDRDRGAPADRARHGRVGRVHLLDRRTAGRLLARVRGRVASPLFVRRFCSGPDGDSRCRFHSLDWRRHLLRRGRLSTPSVPARLVRGFLVMRKSRVPGQRSWNHFLSRRNLCSPRDLFSRGANPVFVPFTLELPAAFPGDRRAVVCLDGKPFSGSVVAFVPGKQCRLAANPVSVPALVVVVASDHSAPARIAFRDSPDLPAS